MHHNTLRMVIKESLWKSYRGIGRILAFVIPFDKVDTHVFNARPGEVLSKEPIISDINFNGLSFSKNLTTDRKTKICGISYLLFYIVNMEEKIAKLRFHSHRQVPSRLVKIFKKFF